MRDLRSPPCSPKWGGTAASQSHVQAHTCAQPMANMACSGPVSAPTHPKTSGDVPASPLQHPKIPWDMPLLDHPCAPLSPRTSSNHSGVPAPNVGCSQTGLGVQPGRGWGAARQGLSTPRLLRDVCSCFSAAEPSEPVKQDIKGRALRGSSGPVPPHPQCPKKGPKMGPQKEPHQGEALARGTRTSAELRRGLSAGGGGFRG